MYKNNLLKKIKSQDVYDEIEHLKVLQLIKDKNESLKLSYIELEKVKNLKRLETKLNLINEKIKKQIFSFYNCGNIYISSVKGISIL